MSSPASQKSLSYISWKLLSELDEIKHREFAWLIPAHIHLINSWNTSQAEYRQWRKNVDNVIADLVANNALDSADWLAATVLREPAAMNPQAFELTIPTGRGSEVIHIRGNPDQGPAATAQEQPGLAAAPVPPPEPGLPAVVVAAPVRPAEPHDASERKTLQDDAIPHTSSGYRKIAKKKAVRPDKSHSPRAEGMSAYRVMKASSRSKYSDLPLKALREEVKRRNAGDASKGSKVTMVARLVELDLEEGNDPATEETVTPPNPVAQGTEPTGEGLPEVTCSGLATEGASPEHARDATEPAETEE